MPSGITARRLTFARSRCKYVGGWAGVAYPSRRFRRGSISRAKRRRRDGRKAKAAGRSKEQTEESRGTFLCPGYQTAGIGCSRRLKATAGGEGRTFLQREQGRRVVQMPAAGRNDARRVSLSVPDQIGATESLCRSAVPRTIARQRSFPSSSPDGSFRAAWRLNCGGLAAGLRLEAPLIRSQPGSNLTASTLRTPPVRSYCWKACAKRDQRLIWRPRRRHAFWRWTTIQSAAMPCVPP